MRLHMNFVALCVALCVAGTVNSYMIDPESCAADYQFVKDMVEQAFSMAEIVLASVNTVPIDPHADQLFQQLFNYHGNEGKAAVERLFAPGPENNKHERTGILSFEQEKTGGIESLGDGINEVVIFCDESRLKRRIKDPLHRFDTKAKRAVSASNPCANAFMYTQTFSKHWDSIQICPWFLEYAKGKKYGTSKDITSLRARLALKGLDKLITNKFYTPIDLLSLWDKCMLHEMMHTKLAGSLDVDGRKGYGWKNCKALAADGKGANNADSWALFASALYWAKQGSPIDENGNFISVPIGNQGIIIKPQAGFDVGEWLTQTWSV
ncbi:hypothetical protein F5B22DRAFT_273509 [Xylaria bambusicola]|uniref:uncharacterized protein n=1 Tax=Xylaria bambusicola TaxID=326684 RepID=UPI002007DC87|nr:uncharacterized protein F5B22DRAFT_273509 [Xylaria bambusicola]KAI0513129.1 hypothetical protein F5B22DRAFT_273509 [Xylaria bambusicola]